MTIGPHRRQLLLLAAALPLAAASQPLGVSRRALRFPRDFGAHEDTALEWWYLTGLLGASADPAAAPEFGYQLTFFRLRNRSDAVQQHPSALAPRQLLLGHVALSDLRAGAPQVLRHAQRLARAGLGARCSSADCALQLRDWSLQRQGPVERSAYQARLGGADFSLRLELQATLPPLLQGDAGYSLKGPLEANASHYYSQPQLDSRAELQLDGRRLTLAGRSWLDHEWSDSLLPTDAVGWDWLGINLLDGGALTAFRLRRADGSALWAGGSLRDSQGRTQSFAPEVLSFTPGRRWHSPLSGAVYPVDWQLRTPLGELRLQALADEQEIDARRSSGLLYWEGASELREAATKRLIGRGYLEMTGYRERMRL
jgi:predicted secreted hydrolase